jgi:NAD(P)-dependent dehydrogenase (short-subunit alcohol dehydrogenase family)
MDMTNDPGVGRRFAGKVAIVTGSSSGIGLATAQRLAREGALVVVNGRRAPLVEEAAAAIVAAGGEAIAVAADVSDPTSVARLVDEAVATYGSLDVLVNNAGGPQVVASEDLGWPEWQRLIETHLGGAFLTAQAAGRRMLAQGSGVIVNVTSVFGHVGMPGRAAYCSAKHGLEGLTKVLASEWGPRGVRVCSVAPGYVATALVDENIARGAVDPDQIEGRTPAGRMAAPDEVAAAIAYLASPEAGFAVGPALTLDGGWMSYGGWGRIADAAPPNATTTTDTTTATTTDEGAAR